MALAITALARRNQAAVFTGLSVSGSSQDGTFARHWRTVTACSKVSFRGLRLEESLADVFGGV